MKNISKLHFAILGEIKNSQKFAKRNHRLII